MKYKTYYDRLCSASGTNRARLLDERILTRILTSSKESCKKLCASMLCLQTVVDHEEFKDMKTGVSRLSGDRHYSASAQGNEGQTCAGDHGTHVAALAAGFERGAAKDAEIVSGAVLAVLDHPFIHVVLP
jgi:hypothetical protein